MREVVDEILNGNYGSETGELRFSQSQIKLTVAPDEVATGSFVLTAPEGSAVKGSVFSTDYRCECQKTEFAGAEVEIPFTFYGRCLEDGEKAKGAFRVISNLGEYTIPFEVTCKQAGAASGTITNLSEFAAFAQTNWSEALDLFYSKGFREVLTNEEPKLLRIWQGLAAYRGQEQNLEEFLITTGKKTPVTFMTEKPTLIFDARRGGGEYQLLEQEMSVTRDGWGYVALNVECEGDFLELEKEILTEEDFLGNYARFPFYVDEARLKKGENRGKLVFYNSFTSFEVEVIVKNGTKPAVDTLSRNRKRMMLEIMKQYELFRIRRIGLASWMEKTSELVEKLIALSEFDPVPCLFKAQLLITRESVKEAQWFLNHAADLMELKGNDDELWAYELYLTTLISRDEDEIQRVTEEVTTLHHKNPESWRIAWLLLYLSAEFVDRPAEKLRFMERQYELGCRSFVIYVEALQTYLSNPALLRKLGDFEKQVIAYGIRKDYFSPDLAERYLELLEKDKEYSPVVCRSLERLYRKRKDARIVRHICERFVRGGILGARALPWYEKGVEDQLRITNLYEAFMASLNPEERKGLPKAAVLYFSLQTKLDVERSAFLYDYVLDNKVLYADVYEKYLLKARDFVAEQVAKCRINKHLARLYTRILTSDMITDQNAETVLQLAFMTRVQAKDDRMKKVILYAKGCVQGREYSLNNGSAMLPIYGEENTLIFEDGFGNRFAEEMLESADRYLNPDLFVPELLTHDIDVPEFTVYLIGQAGKEPLKEELCDKAIRLCTWKGLMIQTRKQICLRLLRQLFEEEKPEKTDEVLEQFVSLPLSLTERMEVARYAVMRSNYDMAAAWMREYGPYFMDGNTLARLLSSLLSRGLGEDQSVVAAADYLFRRGKASALALDYLSKYGDGHLKDLRDLWKEMRENALDVTALEERILIQLIFVGGYVAERSAIFEDYYRNAGDSSVIKAYVIQNSFDYFVKGKTADGIIFRVMLDRVRWESGLPKVCKLAFLKYYAENPSEVSREVDTALDAFLREMMTEKMHFEFYRKLKNQRGLLGELADKAIVEYRTRPGGRARIHYSISRQDGLPGEVFSESMREVFWGICVREFVLFFGEELSYTVTEEIEGQERESYKGTLVCQEPDAESAGSKYGRINELARSQGMQSEELFEAQLEQYYFKEFCGEKLFELQ